MGGVATGPPARTAGRRTFPHPGDTAPSTPAFTILDSTTRRAGYGGPMVRQHALDAVPFQRVRPNRSSGSRGDTVTIYKLGEAAPTIHESVFIADSANIIGHVTVEENASVWFGATIRGDNEPITIGAGSNVQENAVLHTDPGFPLTIERNVTVGHQVMLHGCTIKEGSLIGIQAVILNGAVIGRNCLVGAGAIVTEGKVFPDNSLIL